MPSASEPKSVAGPLKPVSVTTVAPFTTAVVAVNSTGVPSLSRVSVKASAAGPANDTVRLNVTCRLVTFDRWAEPSLTWVPVTRGAWAR